MSCDPEFKDHPKVIEARKLLKEAELDYIKDKKEITNNTMCECGHIRAVHGTSYSINYTGGFCNKCDCLNFLKKLNLFDSLRRKKILD